MKKISLFLVLFAQLYCSAQKNSSYPNDSLKNNSLRQLESKFYKNVIRAKNISNIYAYEFLKRTQLAKNNENIAKGYYFVIKSEGRPLRYTYSDSLIYFSKGKDYSYYPALAYHIRGAVFYRDKNVEAALQNFILADSILGKVDTVATRYYVNQALGLCKSRTKDYNGAIRKFMPNLKYFSKTKNWNSYALNAFSAYDAYISLGQIDSAESIINNAKRKGIDSKTKIGALLQMSTGIINYHRGNYKNSIDTLFLASQTLDSLGDYSNMAYCSHFTGLSNIMLDNREVAISDFKKVDSIFKKNKFLRGYLRGSYIELIKYYNDVGNTKEELHYLNVLMQLDSLSNRNFSYLKDNLLSKYEVPGLLKRREELIIDYQIREKKGLIAILSFLVLISILVLYRFRKIKQINKAKFEKVIAELGQDKKSRNIKNSQSTIPKKDVEILSKAFENYDRKKVYANNSFNKEFIRKDTGVNDHYITDYLRDIIGSSLTVYINTKRIDLAINKMLNESIYRKYTMHAMAEEVGFTNAITFKRVFKGKTGISPLDFIKQRESQ